MWNNRVVAAKVWSLDGALAASRAPLLLDLFIESEPLIPTGRDVAVCERGAVDARIFAAPL